MTAHRLFKQKADPAEQALLQLREMVQNGVSEDTLVGYILQACDELHLDAKSHDERHSPEAFLG